jgi:hypothetical protein
MLRVCFDPRSREATIAAAIAISFFSAFAPFLLTSLPYDWIFPLPARGRSKEIYHIRGRLNVLNIVTAEADIKKSEVPAEVTVSLFFSPMIPNKYHEEKIK